MPTAFLNVQNLQKSFAAADGQRRLVLNKVQFQLGQGDFMVILGGSGAGKTTLLRCLNFLETPDSGQVHWQTLPQDFRAQRRSLAMIFQNFQLLPRQSVLENIMKGCLGSQSTLQSLTANWLRQWPKLDLQKADEYLEWAGLSEQRHQAAGSLSGGQQQRVAIVRALMQDPEVLLADEPISNLDPLTSESILRLLQQLQQERGMTVICNLHSLDFRQLLQARVLGLRQGQVVFDGKSADLGSAEIKEIYQGAKA